MDDDRGVDPADNIADAAVEAKAAPAAADASPVELGPHRGDAGGNAALETLPTEQRGSAQVPVTGTDDAVSGEDAGAGSRGGSGPRRSRTSRNRRNRKRGSFWKELPILVVIALGLALLIKAFLLQAFYIPSASMEPTLHGCPGCTGDRVLVNKLIYDLRPVHRGEIVVFSGPSDWPAETTVAPPGNPVSRFFRDIGGALGVGPGNGTDFIKRVIGVGGDHVACCDSAGHVTVNGVALHERSYLQPGNPPSQIHFSVTVPKGTVFVMGDHRSDSSDSRYHLSDPRHGAIPVDDVVGKAFARVWPPSRWGGLGVPATFHQKGLG